MSDPSVRWLVVTNEETTVVDKYLYGTGKRVLSFDVGLKHPIHLVVVLALSNVDYVANYQAERLRSGLMGAVVFDNYADAFAEVKRIDPTVY